MIDFNILHGLSTDLFLVSGEVNPDIIIEKGCWYICTDTAELFLGVANQDEITLKKINANIIDQVATSIINIKITDGKLIATYSDNTTADLGSVVEDLPTNLSAFTNDVGYATKQEVSEAIAAIPEVDFAGYATESWVNDQGFLKSIPEEFITVEELANEGFIKEHQSLDGYVKSEDISDFITMADIEAENFATEQFVTEAIANQVPVDELAKKEDVVEVKTKLESEVLPIINTAILPKVEELVETAATQQWVEDKGYLTEHQSLEGLATEEFVNKKIAEAPTGLYVVDFNTPSYAEAVEAHNNGKLLLLTNAAPDINSYAVMNYVSEKYIAFTKFLMSRSGTYGTFNTYYLRPDNTWEASGVVRLNKVEAKVADIGSNSLVGLTIGKEDYSFDKYATTETVVEVVTEQVNEVVTKEIETKVETVIQEKVDAGEITAAKAETIGYDTW